MAKRKIEQTAERIESRLWNYELILISVMIIGLGGHFAEKLWGGSLLLVSGLILSIIYLLRWFLSRSGYLHKLTALGLSFGLMGCLFHLLGMQSDLSFMAISFLAILLSLIIYGYLLFSDPKIVHKIDLLRSVLMLILMVLVVVFK